jgi:hypothetical protein
VILPSSGCLNEKLLGINVSRIGRFSGVTWLLLTLGVTVSSGSEIQAGISPSPLAANSTPSWSCWTRVFDDLVMGRLEITEPVSTGMTAGPALPSLVPTPRLAVHWLVNQACPEGASAPSSTAPSFQGTVAAALSAEILVDWPECASRLILAEVQNRPQPFASRLFRPPRSV